MGKEKGENVKEERGGGAWRRGACCDRRRNTELTKVHDGRSRPRRSRRWSSLSSKSRACLREPNSPRTQAAGGGAVVGEAAAQVGVEGGVRPVRTRQQPS